MERYYGVDGVECRVILGEGGNPPVLLLHGFSFRGRTWVEAGVTGVLERLGLRYAAPDMPYGRATDCTKHSRSVDLNVRAAHSVVEGLLGGSPPVIVGASLGGRIALYYATRHPVRGLFLASPAVRGDEDFWDKLPALRVPAFIVRGGRDFVSRRILRELAEALRGEFVEYEGAGHAMYLDMPGRFQEDLERFLREKVLVGGGLEPGGRH